MGFDATVGWGVIAMVVIPGLGFVGWLGKVHLRVGDLCDTVKELHVSNEAHRARADALGTDFLKYRMEVSETYVKNRELEKLELGITKRFETSDAAMVKRFEDVRHEIKNINTTVIAALTVKANARKDD